MFTVCSICSDPDNQFILRDEALRSEKDNHHVVGGGRSCVAGRLRGSPQADPWPALGRPSHAPLQGSHRPQVDGDTLIVEPFMAAATLF